MVRRWCSNTHTRTLFVRGMERFWWLLSTFLAILSQLQCLSRSHTMATFSLCTTDVTMTSEPATINQTQISEETTLSSPAMHHWSSRCHRKQTATEIHMYNYYKHFKNTLYNAITEYVRFKKLEDLYSHFVITVLCKTWVSGGVFVVIALEVVSMWTSSQTWPT